MRAMMSEAVSAITDAAKTHCMRAIRRTSYSTMTICVIITFITSTKKYVFDSYLV